MIHGESERERDRKRESARETEGVWLALADGNAEEVREELLSLEHHLLTGGWETLGY